MIRILVGIDGSKRGERALAWALHYAEKLQTPKRTVSLSLLTVITATEKQVGLTEDLLVKYANRVLSRYRQHILEENPEIAVDCLVVKGKVVESIIDASARHELIVMGSHHGFSLGQTVGGAKSLRVAVSVSIPTVVVPADWTPEGVERLESQCKNVQPQSMDSQNQTKVQAKTPSGIVCAVGFDDSSDEAIAFACYLAHLTHEPLRFITAWGIPSFLQDAAKALGGGISPAGEDARKNLDALVARVHKNYPELLVSGEAIESSSQTQAIIEQSKQASLLVLGTHSYHTLGRALFGSVTHSVLLNLVAPTAIVPIVKPS